MSELVHSVGLAWHIAVRQIRHEWLATLCYAVALAAVLAPLLVLYGLKHGVVSEMEKRLLRNPGNLEISPLMTRTLPLSFFDGLTAQRDVGFMVPRTRPLSLTVFMETKGGETVKADLEPTGPGDPLLDPRAVPADGIDAIVLSTALAQELGYAPGDQVPVIVTRSRDGFAEFEEVRLRVIDVLPAERSRRVVGFVSQAMNTAIEDYRDGYSVPERGWVGLNDERLAGDRPYSGFRLYASSLDGVPSLVTWLRDQGVETYSEVEDVEALRTLDRSLGIVFVILLGIGSAGVLISLGSNLWAHVERSRKDLSVVRLMGGGTLVLIGIPVLEALTIAVAGFAFGALGYLVCDLILTAAFRAPGLSSEEICTLEPWHWLVAFGSTTGFAVIASLKAAARTLSIPPADGLQ
jgi:putative ABC transport system permease protein